MRAVWVRLLNLFRRDAGERESADELAAHLQAHDDDDTDAGMPADGGAPSGASCPSAKAVEKEWTLALVLRKRIVPVLLDIIPLPAELKEFQWIDLSRALNVHAGAHKPHHELGPLLREVPVAFPELDLQELDKQLVSIGLGTAG